MNKEKNSLLRDSRGVIPTAKGYRLLEAGFFYVMKKAEPTGVFLPLTRKELTRLEKLTSRRGDSVKDWLLMAVLAALDCDEGEADFEARKDGEDIVVKIPKKTAARLERAAEFEEMSVAAYVKDGIRRDLALTDEIMASKN